MHPGHLIRCLMRYTNDLTEALNTAIPGLGAQVWAWENRTEESALPHTPLLGLAEFNFDDSSKIWVARFAIVFSTYRDTNMITESFALDVLYDHLKRLNKIPLRDNTSGVINSEAIITAMSVMPTDQSLERNYRPISLEIHATGPGE